MENVTSDLLTDILLDSIIFHRIGGIHMQMQFLWYAFYPFCISGRCSFGQLTFICWWLSDFRGDSQITFVRCDPIKIIPKRINLRWVSIKLISSWVISVFVGFVWYAFLFSYIWECDDTIFVFIDQLHCTWLMGFCIVFLLF